MLYKFHKPVLAVNLQSFHCVQLKPIVYVVAKGLRCLVTNHWRLIGPCLFRELLRANLPTSFIISCFYATWIFDKVIK